MMKKITGFAKKLWNNDYVKAAREGFCKGDTVDVAKTFIAGIGVGICGIVGLTIAGLF